MTALEQDHHRFPFQQHQRVPVINFDDGNNFPPIQHKTISDPRNKVDDVSDAVTDRSDGIFVDDKHEIIPTQFRPAPSLPLLHPNPNLLLQPIDKFA